MQGNIWSLINPQIAFRITRPKYIGMTAPDHKLKWNSKILIISRRQTGKKGLMLSLQRAPTKLVICKCVKLKHPWGINCPLGFSWDFSDIDMHIHQSQANAMLHQMLIPDSSSILRRQFFKMMSLFLLN